MDVWCLTLAIHEMAAINEITTKIDHVLLTCNCFSGCAKELIRACSCWKDVSNFTNFSNCDGVCFEKRIISTTGECALKKNSATIVTYCDIKKFKTLKISIHRSAEIFPLINDLMICKCISYKCVRKGAVLQHSYIMWQSEASSTNHSTLYKSFNLVQIIQRSANLST